MSRHCNECNELALFPMEFQSGQKCVTEIKDMLCAKYIKTLCYIENIEALCSKYTNFMLKIQKSYAQNAETLC